MEQGSLGARILSESPCVPMSLVFPFWLHSSLMPGNLASRGKVLPLSHLWLWARLFWVPTQTNPGRRSLQSCWDSGPHTCESQFLITLCPGVVVVVLGKSDLLMTCGGNSFLVVTQLLSQEREDKKWRWTPISLPRKDTNGTNICPWSQW